MSKKGLGAVNIVKKYDCGAGKTYIVDDAYKDRTQEQIQQTLDNISKIMSKKRTTIKA